jgi:diaminopimelate epimerase
MKITFHKMHGLGNDFVLIDTLENKKIRSLGSGELSSLARTICHRRFGVGADQVLLLSPSRSADFRMQIFNADGGEVEMCGNGIRCFAKYVWSKGYSRKKTLAIETLAGIIRPEKKGDLVRVDMGTPVLEAEKIPLNILQGSKSRAQSPTARESGRVTPDSEPVIDHPLRIENREFLTTCVSMGNPHAVIVVDRVDAFPVAHYGPLIETHELFPKKTNVEFIEIINRKKIHMRVWERGSGETMACGTGASAAAVASALKGLTEREVTVHLAGGDLLIDWADDGRVFMTGPAVKSFEGMVKL